MRFGPALAVAVAALLSTAAVGQTSGVAVGAFVRDANFPNGIASLEQQMCQQYQVCRTLALDYTYENWSFSKLAAEAADVNAGRTPIVAWTENAIDMPKATDVINGVYDNMLQEQAGYFYNLPNHATVIVEFIPEMTDSPHTKLGTFYGTADWYKTPANLQAAGALYQQAQAHIVNIIRKGAPNAKFVFAPESQAYIATVNGVPEWQLFYPGNATVDYVGADHRTGKADLSADKYFREFYAQAVTTNLPVMMTQVCPNKNAANYINSAITEIPALFPSVVTFVYNAATKEGCPFENQAGSLQAFSSLAANSYFQVTF